ncbi:MULTISPECIES: hypothetical protein [Candidatus Ichthyocystis]|uniref:Uncharacterized protein n=1 Tax=Candidatus Ichthyocystis hellenicum TaxID=1561003 RepID=A0A0S4M6T4_9BURK|nr:MULTISPECIES: hypothetical protein [Ichthyocystis]CUT17864.1 hypothetical protein Ark11_1048 [Candidatus Ichthyocystis hellenicum]
MYLYNSGSDCAVNDVTSNNTDIGNSEQETSQDLHTSNPNHNLGYYVDILLKDNSFNNFLKLPVCNERRQGYSYREELLYSEAFESSNLDESNLVTSIANSSNYSELPHTIGYNQTTAALNSDSMNQIIGNEERRAEYSSALYNIEQPSTSSALKNQFIGYNKTTAAPSSESINQIVNNEGTTVEYYHKLYDVERPSSSSALKNQFIRYNQPTAELNSESMNQIVNNEGTTAEYYHKLYDVERPSSSSALKNQFIRYNQPTDQPTAAPSSESIIQDSTFTEQNAKESATKSTEQSVRYYSINESKKQEECANKKKLVLRVYRRDNFYCTEYNSSIYRNAIKKIDIDGSGLFSNSVLEELDEDLRIRGFIKPYTACIDLCATYSNVRKYVLGKFSPYLNDIAIVTDIQMTSGMSISDLRHSYISNPVFFEKLGEICKKIEKEVLSIPNNSLSYIFQSYVDFYYTECLGITNKRRRLTPKKNRFTSMVKKLILDTVSGLPSSIVSKIEKFDKSDILDGAFSNVHGALISRSLINNIICFFDCNRYGIAPDEGNVCLFNNLLEKLGNIVRTSYIFHDGETTLPDDPIVEQLSKYLLSDIYALPAKLRKKLKLFSKNTSTLRIGKEVKEGEVSRDYVSNNSILYQSIGSKRTASEEIKKWTILEKLQLKEYCKINLRSTDFTSSIYINAIKKINIDTNGLFINTVLREIDSHITRKGFKKSSIDLSLTYSNIHKYILGIIHPCINNIITTTDVLITYDMSILDMRYSCLSNSSFFEKLRENCKEIAKKIYAAKDNTFLKMFNSRINFGADGNLDVRSVKKTLCSKIKEFIIEIISNLPNSIIHEIKNFSKNEIIEGLFSDIHGVLVSKSLIRNVNSFFNHNMLPSNEFKDNLSSINNLITILSNAVKTSPILHDEKLFFPSTSIAELLSKYILSDVYDIPAKLHEKINPYTESESTSISPIINCNLYRSFKKDNASDKSTSVTLPKKSKFIVKMTSNWNPNFITSLNIYELAIQMIDIDKEEFERSFTHKMKQSPSLGEYINEGIGIKFNLSRTYIRIKNYILEIFNPFLKKEFYDKTNKKIELGRDITLDKLVYEYTSDKELFFRLRKFCNKVIDSIEKCGEGVLCNLIQYSVGLETDKERHGKIIMNKKNDKIYFNEDIAKLLVNNISSIPEKISDIIKSFPPYKIVEEHFSQFYNIYVDNASLLKAKSVFDCVKDKVINDPLLSELIDKISSGIIDEFANGRTDDGKAIDISKQLYKIISNYTVYGSSSSPFSYLRKLVREEATALKESMRGTVMVMHEDRIEVASESIKYEILDKLRSNLITSSIKLYKNLCFKKYKDKCKKIYK